MSSGSSNCQLVSLHDVFLLWSLVDSCEEAGVLTADQAWSHKAVIFALMLEAGLELSGGEVFEG